MSCSKVVTSLVSLIVLLAFVACLTPQVFWSKVDGHEINLWENCYTDQNITDAAKNCTTFGRPDPFNAIKEKDDVKALRDGTIAACVFVVLFTGMSMLCVCCSRKWGVVICSFIAALCATASIGAWVEFMQHKGKTWNIDPKEIYQTADVGLALAAAGMVFSYIAFFSSFCIGKSHSDKYGELA